MFRPLSFIAVALLQYTTSFAAMRRTRRFLPATSAAPMARMSRASSRTLQKVARIAHSPSPHLIDGRSLLPSDRRHPSRRRWSSDAHC